MEQKGRTERKSKIRGLGFGGGAATGVTTVTYIVNNKDSCN